MKIVVVVLFGIVESLLWKNVNSVKNY